MTVDVSVTQLDPESEHIREVCARFGAAMFHIQGLERQLAILLATAYGPGLPEITRKEFDNLLESLFQKTLGSLISRLRQVTDLTDEIEMDLERALSKRNWLAHDYFWDRAVEFMTEKGRTSMIDELEKLGAEFRRLDHQFTQITRVSAQKYGITEEVIEKELQRLLQTSS